LVKMLCRVVPNKVCRVTLTFGLVQAS
jgi:hypothetical protein